MEPSEEALDPPALAVALERSAVLRGLVSSPPHMRCDQFDAVRCATAAGQQIAVVRLIANQSLPELMLGRAREAYKRGLE